MIEPPPPPSVEDLLRHRPFVRNLARRLVADDDEAAEIVQQTWLRVFSRPPSHGSAVRSWLSRVVRSVAISRFHAETARRSVETDRAAWTRGAGRADVDVLDREALERDLARALRQLSRPHARAIRLRYYEGLHLQEIATREGVSVEAVRSRIKRSLKQLRASLDASWSRDRGRWCSSLVALAGLDETRHLPLAAAGAAAGLCACAVWAFIALVPVGRGAGVRTRAAHPVAGTAAEAPQLAEAGTPGARTPVPPPAPRAARVRVHVVDETTGNPVENVLVRLERVDRSPRPAPRSQASGGDGRTSFEDLEAGLWTLAPERGDPRTLGLAAGQDARVDLALPSGLAFRGSVLGPGGAPVAGAEIWASFPARRDQGRVLGRSDEHGGFALSGVDPSSWIGARLAGCRPSRLRRGQDGARGPLALQLREGGALHGLVHDPAGQPVAGAEVSLEVLEVPLPRFDRDGLLCSNPYPVESARTDGDGSFRFPGALLAPSRTTVRRTGYREATLTLALAGRDADLLRGERALQVQLDPSPEPLAYDRRTIRGLVLDETGAPVSGAHVLARPAAAASGPSAPLAFLTLGEPGAIEALSDALGRFTFDAEGERVPYDLFRLGGDGVRGPPLDARHLSASEDWIVLRSPGGPPASLFGYLEQTEADAARVLLSSPLLAAPLARDLPTGSGGFRFDGLLAGRYRVSVLLPDDLRNGVVELELGAGTAHDLGRLCLTAPGSIRARVEVEGDDLARRPASAWLHGPDSPPFLLRKGTSFGRGAFDDDGTLTLVDLAPGRYELCVVVPSFVPETHVFEVAPGAVARDAFVLRRGMDHHLLLTSDRDERLELTLLHADGRPVRPVRRLLEGGVAHVSLALDPGPYRLRWQRAPGEDAEARFTVERPGETTHVELRASGPWGAPPGG